MDPGGCRLCLDPHAAGPIYSLDNPNIKQQLDTVFNFAIKTSLTAPSVICQLCSTTVSDFYHFSQTVRKNQERLERVEDTGTLKTEPVEPEAVSIKVEPTEFVEAQIGKPDEAVSDREFKEELSEEDVDFSDEDDESYEPPAEEEDEAGETSSKRKGKESVKAPRKPRKRKARNSVTREQAEVDFKKINGFYKMSCEECVDVELEDYAKLDAHHKEVHNRKGYILCCQRKLDNRYKMLEHMYYHQNPKAFYCEACNKSFKGKNSLTIHMQAYHSREEDLLFKCDVCPQAFPLARMLRTHQLTHQKEPCPECGKILSSRSALRAHQKNMHSDIDRRMICDTCGQEFLNKVCFERHVKEHAGIEVLQKFQCHICQAWLRGERGLQFHLRYTHYDREKTHICEVCRKQYPTSRALLRHRQIVHVAEKFECEFCGAKFKQALNLKEHRTIHTGEVLYSCEYCDKSMNSRANFYVHIKKNHPLQWAMKKQQGK